MSDMDAGLAAILGAAVGGILGASGTLGTALVSGRLQGRNNHEQWQRDGRRAAYSELLRFAADLEQEIDGLYHRRTPRTPNDVVEQAERVIERLHALRATAATVMVEGPPGVSRLAASMTDYAKLLTDHLIDGDPGHETSWEDGSFWDTSMGYFVRLRASTEQFTSEAQKALDQ
ncbi:hypothetical protein [Streptomyces sp. NPDC055105]|uniref:hypothetical protein n=1 Tax=Streptomyces sp. NPDC055105 TaxID=3365719 RepID=UPI0037D537D2